MRQREYSDTENEHEADDGIISRSDRDHFAQDAFKQLSDGMGSAKIGETDKFLGIFEADAGVVEGLNGIYNLGADWVSTEFRPRAFQIAESLAPKLNISNKAAKTLGAVVSIGGTAALKMGNYFGKIYHGFSGHVDERRQLAHDIAPVLDDLKGGHSLISLQRVGEKDNEVIYAHRTRIGKIAKSQNMSNVLGMLINSGASLLFDIGGMKRIWQKREAITPVELSHIFQNAPSKTEAKEEIDGMVSSLGGKNAFKAGVIGLLPSLSKRYVATSQYKLAKELSPYSALEMILELQQQVTGNPDASSFQEPRNYKDPRAHRKECPLEEYLVRILIQHQKDMAYLQPEKHTEIRPALRVDLAAVVKPLAHAIREGDVSALSLIRLVGEGKIIQKHGRAIASSKEMHALIAKEAPKQANYEQVDPAKDYKEDKKAEKSADEGHHKKTRVTKSEYQGKLKDRGRNRHEEHEEMDGEQEDRHHNQHVGKYAAREASRRADTDDMGAELY